MGLNHLVSPKGHCFKHKQLLYTPAHVESIGDLAGWVLTMENFLKSLL
jgi:hypothetical protein